MSLRDVTECQPFRKEDPTGVSAGHCRVQASRAQTSKTLPESRIEAEHLVILWSERKVQFYLFFCEP